MAAWNEYMLDERKAEEIGEQFRELARSYVPEWNFSENQPDIGSIIALIYAGQTAENIRLFNSSFSRFRVAFAELLGVSLKPAKAAESIVVMSPADQDVSGITVRKGSKLTAQTEDGENLIFETMHDLSVSGALPTDLIGISERSNSIISYAGELREATLFPEDLPEKNEQEENEQRENGSEIWKQELVLYHEYLFDRAGAQIGIRFQGDRSSEELAGLFSNPSGYRFFYYSEEGLTEAEQVRKEGDRILVYKAGAAKKVVRDGREMGALVLKQQGAAQKVCLKSIELFGDSLSTGAEYIYDGTAEQQTGCFRPFGEELALYQECYIGQDTVFSRRGAQIVLEFGLSFEEKRFAFREEEAEEKLPIVRKRPRYQEYERPFLCMAGEVSYEYFNGTGWKRLQTERQTDRMFGARENAGRQQIVFQAPHDWQAVQIGAYEGHCLRLRVVQAEHCYMRPAIHYIPVIHDLKIVYSYNGQAMQPDGAGQLSGTCYEDLTPFLKRGERCSAFRTFPYSGNALYIGFQKKWQQGPVSLFFRLCEEECAQNGRIEWQYSTGNGFKELRMSDYTGNLRRSGIVVFEPPSDLGRQEVEGISRYWLRLADPAGNREELEHSGDFIKEILPNAVMVHNVETSRPEDYYMDAVVPNMSFPLYGENTLSADVWVNEWQELSRGQMEQMLREMPDRVQAEYDYMGEISEFYIKWEEADSFLEAQNGARLYQIDRVNNRIVFGDGIRVRIPRNTSDTAFRVIRHSCKGSQGNVSAGSINGFHGNMLFISEIYNPVAGFGGSDLESMDNALKRSSNIVSSRKRLVSENDYVRETLTFSENVAQAACVCGVDRYGKRMDRLINLVVLMKDYKEGTYSFYRLRRELQKYLTEHCELDCQETEIRIEEPVFIQVSIELWLSVPDIGNGLELRRQWLRKIEAYLEPGNEPGRGWQIGNFPREEQIGMMLHAMEKGCRVECYSITAACPDAGGVHEIPFEKAGGNPFAVCCNGEHHIYINGGMQDAER
ncbi:MAG: hypothetical protein J6B10_03000 [Lachnospiraceae bacterium]|nr:hypothetical protein [Lachnospiraceae bacterium]